MNNMQISKIMYIGLVLAIIIIIALTYIAFFNSNNDFITAKEAINIASPYAEEWNENAVLVAMTDTDYSADPATYVFPEGKNGKFSEWFCTYVVETDIGNSTSAIQFKVSSNGTVIEQFQVNNSAGFVYEGMVLNWTIDSDDAYEIAISNEEVSMWLQEHPNSKMAGFGLSSKSEGWTIIWCDDEVCRTVYIDYATGEY
ncbi:MAG: hypothetical protein KAJ33_04435 [Thermoplasmata archaeon]|nr:hypothetical protein [Thermoplasmata archaeon]